MTTVQEGSYLEGLRQGIGKALDGMLTARLLLKWKNGYTMTDGELDALHRGLKFICDFMGTSNQLVIGSYYFEAHREVEFAIVSRSKSKEKSTVDNSFTITHEILAAREVMEEALRRWLDAVHQRQWEPNWEAPFGTPVAGSFRAFEEASRQWAELVLKANEYGEIHD